MADGSFTFVPANAPSLEKFSGAGRLLAHFDLSVVFPYLQATVARAAGHNLRACVRRLK